MVVEFIGVSGSGKTTVVRALLDRLSKGTCETVPLRGSLTNSSTFKKIEYRIWQIKKILHQALANIGSTVTLLNEVDSLNTSFIATCVNGGSLKWLRLCLLSGYFKSNNKVGVFDQGPIQFIPGLNRHSSDRSDFYNKCISTLLKVNMCPDLVIALDVSSETAIDRCRNRGGEDADRHANKIGYSSLNESISDSIRILNDQLKSLERHNIEYIVINNDGRRVESVVDNVVEAICMHKENGSYKL